MTFDIAVRQRDEARLERNALAAELAEAKARVAELAAQRPASLKQRVQELEAKLAAVEAWCDGACPLFDKPTAETVVEPNTYTHPYMRKCNRCGKELRFKEPCLATVVYCDIICAD